MRVLTLSILFLAPGPMAARAQEDLPREDLYRAGEAYWEADYDTASALLSGIDLLALSPKETLFYFKFLGATRLANGDEEGAAEAFARILDLDPVYQIGTERFSPTVVEVFDRARRELAERHYEEGKESLAGDDADDAVASFELALRLNPRHAMAGELLPLARERLPVEPPTPVAPPVPEEAVSRLNPASYEIGTLEAGQRVYVDRDYVLAEVPEVFRELPTVRTANDHKVLDPFSVTFELSAPSTVFVAHDQRISDKPSWLGRFAKTSYVLEVVEIGHEDNVARYDVYRGDFEAGPVTLGANAAGKKKAKGKSMYFVFVERK